MSIKKAWRSWSVASKIILIFLCALVPVNVLLIYSTQSYMAALRFQMINSGRNVMELAMLRLDNQMDTMELYLYTQSTEDSDFIRVSMDEGDDFFLVSLHSVYRDFSNNLAVNSISGFYYLMAEESQQITHLKIESYERELEKSKILMRNIQLQVRPHFMLNLFHLIYSMAQIQNYKGIQEMTLYLSKYFRKLFSKGDVHTLAEECELVSGYFKVLYTQYPDCFGFTQELDESVKEVKIPTFLLHSIMENVGKYAVSVGNYIDITLRSYPQGGMVVLEVVDDGPGIPPDILEQIQRQVPVEKKDGRHIGIWNARKRLKLLCGEEAELLVESRFSEGTKYTVLLPRNSEGGNGK